MSRYTERGLGVGVITRAPALLILDPDLLITKSYLHSGGTAMKTFLQSLNHTKWVHMVYSSPSI